MKRILTGLFLLALLALTGCPTPTDGETTKPADTKETVATPTFSPVAGTYTSAQSVAIACATSGASIYYTTNGDTPTGASALYSAPITVSATSTVKAIAIKSGMTDSAVASAAYTINIPADTGGLEVDIY